VVLRRHRRGREGGRERRSSALNLPGRFLQREKFWWQRPLHDPPRLPRLGVGGLPILIPLRLSMEGLRIGFVMSRSYIFLCVLE